MHQSSTVRLRASTGTSTAWISRGGHFNAQRLIQMNLPRNSLGSFGLVRPPPRLTALHRHPLRRRITLHCANKTLTDFLVFDGNEVNEGVSTLGAIGPTSIERHPPTGWSMCRALLLGTTPRVVRLTFEIEQVKHKRDARTSAIWPTPKKNAVVCRVSAAMAAAPAGPPGSIPRGGRPANAATRRRP